MLHKKEESAGCRAAYRVGQRAAGTGSAAATMLARASRAAADGVTAILACRLATYLSLLARRVS